MNKDLIIQNRKRVYSINRNSAKLLKEINADVSYVEIAYTMIFSTLVYRVKPLIDKIVLYPEDKLFLHIRCLNKDCTGNGFYLMDEIEKAICLRQVVIGEKKCDGKEDWKYLESSGCSCLTTLKYTITPIFNDRSCNPNYLF